jgi:hypothetical protein
MSGRVVQYLYAKHLYWAQCLGSLQANIGTKRCAHPAPQSSNWKHGHVPVIFYRDSIR